MLRHREPGAAAAGLSARRHPVDRAFLVALSRCLPRRGLGALPRPAGDAPALAPGAGPRKSAAFGRRRGAVAMSVRYLARPTQVLAAVTVLLWCVVMYVGSRTAADGFPQRFERDLGAPLSVVAAFGLVIVVRALLAQRAGARTALTTAAAAAAVVVGAVVAVQAARGLAASAGPNREVLTHRVAAAGRWLGQHNTGGNIISTPYMNPGITNRAVLAMGGYTGLQSYGAFRIAHPRSLPPAGRQPLLDSQQVLLHPASCQAAGILARDDVRYVVLYRFGQGADLPTFATDPGRYRRVFQNSSVIIYAAAHHPCPAG